MQMSFLGQHNIVLGTEWLSGTDFDEDTSKTILLVRFMAPIISSMVLWIISSWAIILIV